MIEDITKKAVLVLAVVAILISVLSTLIVFNAVSGVKIRQAQASGSALSNPSASAQVELSVNGPGQAPRSIPWTQATGKVVLEVVNPALPQ